MVWTLHFHYRGHEFNPWSENSDSVSLVVQTKKKVTQDLAYEKAKR